MNNSIDLLRLQNLCDLLTQLMKMESVLVNRLLDNGVTWQELARVNKIQAIILYRRMYHHDDLLECKRIVEEYLRSVPPYPSA